MLRSDHSEIIKTDENHNVPKVLKLTDYFMSPVLAEPMNQKPNGQKQKQLITHTGCTKFLHSSLQLKYINDDKKYGIIATKKIPFGSIISVEKPMLYIEDHPDFYVQYVDKDRISLPTMMHGVSVAISAARHMDGQFRRIWDEELETNQEMLAKYENTMKQNEIPLSVHTSLADWIKFMTFWHGSMNQRKPYAIYSVLSRINHGLPQNVAMIYGDRVDEFVCILVATKNIQSGEEIVVDYFGNLYTKEALDPHTLKARRFRGMEVGFAADSMLPITLSLVSDDVTKEDKRRIIRAELYSNGIIGKQFGGHYKAMDGCVGLSVDECIRKRDLRKSIVSGDIFSVLRGEKDAELWAGDQFVQQYTRWSKTT